MTEKQKRLRYITKTVSRLKSLGYVFEAQFESDRQFFRYNSIEFLNSIDFNYMLSKTIHYYKGSFISGTDFHKLPKEERKPYETKEIYDINGEVIEELPQIKNIVYNRIINLIDNFPTKGARHLRKMLNKEISDYGLDVVASAFEQLPEEAIQEAERIAYYSDSGDNIDRAFKRLHDIIQGYISDNAQNQVISEITGDFADYGEYS